MGRPVKGTPRIIPSCHPERRHQALGLCSTCYLRQYTAKRRETDPSYERYRGWAKHIEKKYNLTPEQFHIMLEGQGGHCKLCTMTPNEKYNSFCVDHDHKTGRIRGILCKFCNSKLGWYENRKDKIGEYLAAR